MRKKEVLTLSVEPGDKKRLEAIAEALNIFWGDSPSPSKMIRMIATGELLIVQPSPSKPTNARGRRLQKAIATTKKNLEEIQEISSKTKESLKAIENLI